MMRFSFSSPFSVWTAESSIPLLSKAHHLPGRQIHDGGQGLAHQFLRLIELVDAGEDLPVGAGAVIQREAQQLVGLFHGFAGLDLHHPEIGLAEGVEVHRFGELRLHLHGQAALPS